MGLAERQGCGETIGLWIEVENGKLPGRHGEVVVVGLAATVHGVNTYYHTVPHHTRHQLRRPVVLKALLSFPGMDSITLYSTMPQSVASLSPLPHVSCRIFHTAAINNYTIYLFSLADNTPRGISRPLAFYQILDEASFSKYAASVLPFRI